MKILLTGFNSFRGVRRNPSEQVVRILAARGGSFAGVELVAAVLPTEYRAGSRKLRRLIRGNRPDAVVCLGVAPRRDAFSLERVALNLDDEATPDNAGVVRRARPIVRGGPDVYWSTLPLDRLLKQLRRRRIKAVISNHAGAFLCNHAFYLARHETARRGIPCGFLHLPGTGRRPSGNRPSAARMVRAVECCLTVLAEDWKRGKRHPRKT
ncbi:MAG TPA: hypothetical protein VNN17_00095 [Terriglobia bacterium]|nr:hypothetical protein [Terriglobia bacterium]